MFIRLDPPRRSAGSTKIQQACQASPAEMREASLRIKSTSLGMYGRSYHIRILHGLLYGNKDYHRFGVKNRADCQRCGAIRQDSLHVLWDCPASQALRRRVVSLNPRFTMSKKQALLGDNSAGATLLALLLNIYLHRSNYHDNPLSLSEFQGTVRSREEVERSSAIRRDKICKHAQKWQGLAWLT